jgi:YD repeat-containing protein
MWCIALLLFPVIASACVDSKTGNYCVQGKDITQASWEHELNLTRAYNSKSAEIGWFGYGWGTSFETRLQVMPNGSAIVIYPDTGRVERFDSEDKADVQKVVDKIVGVVMQKKEVAPDALSAFRSQLILDEEFRRAKVIQYGLLAQLPIGEKLHSNQCAKAIVERINDEYRHVTCGKETDYFDMAGRLIRHEEDGYTLFIHYSGERPDTIEDSLGQKLMLKWTATGHIAEAKISNDAPAINYRYDDKDNLVFASDAGGNDASYEYDIKHKMTATSYPDKTRRTMQYDESGRITALTEADGELMSYSYRADPKYPSLHHWTVLTKTGEGVKPIMSEAEYLKTLNADGIERLSRVIKTGEQGLEEFVLDDKERIKEILNSNGTYSAFTYHSTLGKVTSVLTNEGRTDFNYDAAGNVVGASNDNGQRLKLAYDNHNRIVRLVENNKAKHIRRDLTFKYNVHNKPIKISMKGKGTINVEYDPHGEITQVYSKQGASIAIEVSRAFSELLALVKVAGANYCL